MDIKNQPNVDVLIIGAGLCGTMLAHVLGKKGINTALVEKRKKYPDNFRAEKFEPHQWALLNDLNLQRYIQPKGDPTGTVRTFFNKDDIVDVNGAEQYGFRYNDTVNNLRDTLPKEIKIIYQSVIDIEPNSILSVVTLANGNTISARLIIIASGGSQKTPGFLGLKYSRERALRSLSFGFDITSTQNFKFRGLTYYSQDKSDGVDYVTCFMIGDTMRVNLFTQWTAKKPEVKLFRDQPKDQLQKYFPGLQTELGDFNIATKIQVFPTEYYRIKRAKCDGLIVLADEFQSVSPTTGSGLNKVTKEVELLNELIPKWLKSNGMGWQKTSEFYKNDQKLDTDSGSMSSWIYYTLSQKSNSHLKLYLKTKFILTFWRIYLRRYIPWLYEKIQ